MAQLSFNIVSSFVPAPIKRSQTGLYRDYSFLVAALMAIWRHARNSGAELAEIPQMAPPSCRRWEREGRSHHNSRREPARSGSAPYQADLAIEYSTRQIPS